MSVHPPANFTARSTARDVIEGIDLTGRRALVTGGASGIGLVTARTLAQAGAEVTLAVRNPQSARPVAAEIEAATGSPVHLAHLDLTDLAGIDAFTAAWEGPLHILVNNAGVMALPASCVLNRGGRASSPPTISGTPPSPWACTKH
ncbi:SDR family NAD(P)-dependent oxidoreductase [Streptomyces sp. T1317-0309]|nr:SDR family NAD(P)-dependent oxidoreductase [Streptomyces sp. T1317-0309]